MTSVTNAKKKDKSTKSMMDLTEHRKKCLNERLTFKEKAAYLLSGGPKEGDATLSEFYNQTAFFERRDGRLGIITWSAQRGMSPDGGRTFEYLSNLVLPPVPTRPIEPQMGGGSGYNGVNGLTRLPSGRLGITWSQCYPVGGNQDVARSYFRTSNDDGETWSEDVRMNLGEDKGMPFFDTLRVLKSGRLIQPVRWCHWAGNHNRKVAYCTVKGERIELEGHGHHPELEVAYCYFSDDEGKTWSRSKADIIGWLQDGWGHMVPCDEPSLDQLPDGRLLMLIRTTIGRLLRCFSADEGETWSIPEPSPLAASYAPCAVRRIPQTGDLLCVWNQVSANEIRRGFQRQRLTAAVTRDGQTWKHFRAVDWHPTVPENSGYIPPEEKIQICRSLDDVGELPEGFGNSDYPTIFCHGEEIVISYPHGKGRHPDTYVSAMKHRVLPLKWFYKR